MAHAVALGFRGGVLALEPPQPDIPDDPPSEVEISPPRPNRVPFDERIADLLDELETWIRSLQVRHLDAG